MAKIKSHSLYLIITEEYGRGRRSLDIAESAIAGGVDIIQLREKRKSVKEILKIGKELSKLCEKNKVIFIMNDDPYLAKKSGADGVHLGQEDSKQFPASKTREILGNDKIVGISTHSVREFEKANVEDVDYIAFGPIFPTKPKDYFLGTNDVRQILKIARKPLFFIGGINLKNIGRLLEKGANNISLIRAITEADDIASAARSFRRKLDAEKPYKI
ncbi:MAG: thiamine phosphate synthase [Candidatus Omnitrophota bacterium]